MPKVKSRSAQRYSVTVKLQERCVLVTLHRTHDNAIYQESIPLSVFDMDKDIDQESSTENVVPEIDESSNEEEDLIQEMEDE